MGRLLGDHRGPGGRVRLRRGVPDLAVHGLREMRRPRDVPVTVGPGVAALPQVQGVGREGAPWPADVDVAGRREEGSDRLINERRQEMAKGLPDRPASTKRPTTEELKKRLDQMRRLQAGRDGKN